MDTIWLAEAYPWWRKHGMEARSSTGVAALMAPRDEAADDRLGDHRRFDAPSGAGGDGRARRAGGGRARALHPRLRDFEDLPQQHEDADEEDARADARRGRRSRAASSPASGSTTTATRGAPTCPRSRPTRTRRARCRRSTSRRPRRRCRRSPARSPTAASRRRSRRRRFVRYTRDNVGGEIDVGCTVVASIHETDRDAGRDGAREIAGMYLANKVQNIQGAADTLLELAGHRAGRDPAGRRGDGAGRPARGEGARSPTRSSTSAGRSRARPTTASRRSRSTGTPAARTSCSSCGAPTGTSRSGSSARRSSRTFRA